MSERLGLRVTTLPTFLFLKSGHCLLGVPPVVVSESRNNHEVASMLKESPRMPGTQLHDSMMKMRDVCKKNLSNTVVK